MKKIYPALFTILFCFQAQAASKVFGLGVQLGDPTGITAKYKLSRINSIAGAIGSNHSRVNITGVYLWEKSRIFKIDQVPVDLYYGVGGRLKEKNDEGDDELNIGVRAPVGLKVQFKNPSIEVYAQLAGTLDITPDTDVDISISAGGRYFF